MSLIFDSHLDLAWNALAWKRNLQLPLSELNACDDSADAKFRGRATTCLPEMHRAKLAVCLATMMARVPYGDSQVHGETLDFSTHEQAFAYAQGQLAYYLALERIGEVRLIKTASQLRAHWDAWKSGGNRPLPIGLIVAMEGADAIVAPEQAQLWFEAGLRCSSLVHYGTSAYAVGTGQDGPLTEKGRRLLQAFESVGMILDLTHLSDTSFYQVIECFVGPVCASHQACRALVPGQRQFSDAQIKIVIQRGGVLGIPCDAWMLYAGWERGVTSRDVVAINALADHIDHICQLAGNCQHVCVGSDLDGGFGTEQTPTGLDSIADLQKLCPILSQRGYGDVEIDALLGENWLRFFLQHLPK